MRSEKLPQKSAGNVAGSLCAVAGFLAVSLGVADVSAAGQYEQPANRSAAAIWPPNSLSGPHYTVRDSVVSYGYMHTYTVDSDFATFEVTGDGALRKLINEIGAIAALREVKNTEAFAEAVKEAAKAPIELGKNLIANPVDTVSGIPRGVGRIFGNVYTSLKMTHDPAEDSRLKQALFVSSWKRDFAAKHSIDVYSSNATLQEELNSVGWAAAIGGLSVSAATLPAQSTFVVAMKNARFANQIGNALNEEPPSRLRIINKDKLLAMGVSESLADRFLDHDSFTPRHDTIIVANLEELGSARGRDVFVEAALVAEGEEEANFFMNTAQTMRGYHETVSPIREITTSGGFTIAQAANGSALLPFPLDYGVWSGRAHQLTSFLRQNYSVQGFNGSFDLWVTGTISPTARQELTKLGFNITEDVDRRVDFLD